MKRQHVTKPKLYSPAPETGPLALKAVPIRPVFPDAGFGKHWPFFPFAILFALLLLIATNRMQANASSSPVERLISQVQEVNSHIKNFGRDTLASAPAFGIDSWKTRGSMHSEICSFESSVRKHLLHRAEENPSCTSNSERWPPPDNL